MHDINLGVYEVLPTEPLHDMKEHICNVVSEIKDQLFRGEKQLCEKTIEFLVQTKEHFRGSDREMAIVLSKQLTGLILGILAFMIGSTIANIEVVDTNPDFIGCYKDDKTLDDNFHLINARALGYQVERYTTKQDCVDQCAAKGFLYAGLQNGDLCFCGNTFDKYGRADDSECDIKCRKPDEVIEHTNNPFDSCGGRWRNSVYAVTGVRSAERDAARKWWQI